MKTYIVYLYRSPDCIRGWLAYIQPGDGNRATFKVMVDAETGARAKNKAITTANKGFPGVRIIACNLTDELWGVNNFPELKQYIKRVGL